MPYTLSAGSGFNAGAAAMLLIVVAVIGLWIAPMVVGHYVWTAKGHKGEAEGLFFAACLSWFGVLIALTLRDAPTVAFAATTSPVIPTATPPDTLREAV